MGKQNISLYLFKQHIQQLQNPQTNPLKTQHQVKWIPALCQHLADAVLFILSSHARPPPSSVSAGVSVRST